MAKKARRSLAQTDSGAHDVRVNDLDVNDPQAVLEYKLRAADELAADLKRIFDDGGGYEDASERVGQFIAKYSAPRPSDRYHPNRLLFFGDGSDINNLIDGYSKAAWPAYFPRQFASQFKERAVHGLLVFLPWFIIGGKANPSRRPALLDELRKACEAYLVERPASPSRGVVVQRQPPPDAASLQLPASGNGGQVANPIPKFAGQQQPILKALLKLNAVSIETRTTTAKIAKELKAAGAAAAFAADVSELQRRDFVGTKEGRGGGCWLTELGQQVAKTL